VYVEIPFNFSDSDRDREHQHMGINGQNLGPVSTTNGLTEQVLEPHARSWAIILVGFLLREIRLFWFCCYPQIKN
jgi:hypothetical protein